MLWLLLLQVLASCLWLGHSEVVKSFASCPQFFYQNTPPNNGLQPANPAWICQRYNNRYYYATLYDRNRRIPVYSAYTYEPGNAPRPKTWLVEPQLIDPTYSKDMEEQSTLLERVTIEALKKSQAVLEDYNGLPRLSHGHLNPSGHHNTYRTKFTTFTLTNIVPQDKKLNSGSWSRYEVGTMSKRSKNCKSTYVITGAVPGQDSIGQGRVNVPSYIWSAACCQTNTNMKAWAVIAENNKDAVELLTLGELEARLSKLYGRGQVALFHRDCPR